MEMQYPLWLLAVIPFLGLLFYLRRPRKIIRASKLLFQSPSWLDKVIIKVRKPLWFLTAMCLIYALAAPTEGQEQPPAFEVQNRLMILCIDVSTSMGEGPDSAMEKIKQAGGEARVCP